MRPGSTSALASALVTQLLSRLLTLLTLLVSLDSRPHLYWMRSPYFVEAILRVRRQLRLLERG